SLQVTDTPRKRTLNSSADGSFLFANVQGNLIIWNALTGKIVQQFILSDAKANPVLMSADDKLIAIIDKSGYDIIDISSGKRINSFKVQQTNTTSVTFTSDGMILQLDAPQGIAQWSTNEGLRNARPSLSDMPEVILKSALSRRNLAILATKDLRTWDLQKGGLPRIIPLEDTQLPMAFVHGSSLLGMAAVSVVLEDV